MNAELETFFVDKPRYHRWLKEHPDAFIAKVALRDGILAIHRVSCENASPRDGAPGGMAAVRVCADVRDDLIDWAGPYLAVKGPSAPSAAKVI